VVEDSFSAVGAAMVLLTAAIARQCAQDAPESGVVVEEAAASDAKTKRPDWEVVVVVKFVHDLWKAQRWTSQLYAVDVIVHRSEPVRGDADEVGPEAGDGRRDMAAVAGAPRRVLAGARQHNGRWMRAAAAVADVLRVSAAAARHRQRFLE